jgi:hypothetical protein
MKVPLPPSIGSILARIFSSMHEDGAHTLVFDSGVFFDEAARLGRSVVNSPFDLTDYVCYDPAYATQRRGLLPARIRRTEPKGWQWRLQRSTVQAKQDIACCAEKFPELVCRAISAQFMDDSRIALFELCVDEDGLVKTVDERHYRLVPADQIDGSGRRAYRTRAR